MGIIHAFTEGLSSATRRIGIVFWLWIASLLLALPASLVIIQGIDRSLDDSQMSQKLADGYDDYWYRDFHGQAEGILETFHPTMIGIGAILNGLDDFIQGDFYGENLGLLSVGIAYLLLWVFAAGGILSSLADSCKFPFPEFASKCAEYFWRYFRLAIFLGLGYWILFGWLLPTMNDLVDSITRETIDERVVFLWTLAKYGIFGLLLALLNLTGDYAKIVCVLERRRSALVSLWRALKIGFGNLRRTLPLYLLLFVLGIVLFFVYWIFAPGAGQQSYFSVAWALIVGQIYIASRIWLRVCFWGAQITLCRGILQESRPEPAPAPSYAAEEPVAAE